MIDNIKKLIRENIGNPVMISLAGSHVYGTNDINSDVDYFALIKDGAEQAIDMQYEFKKDEESERMRVKENVEGMEKKASEMFNVVQKRMEEITND